MSACFNAGGGVMCKMEGPLRWLWGTSVLEYFGWFRSSAGAIGYVVLLVVCRGA